MQGSTSNLHRTGIYNLQKVFVKSEKIVISSSLPRIISRLNTILLKSGKCAKLLIGPTVPSPGPIPAMHVAVALADVIGSLPLAVMIKVPIIKTKR